MNTVYQVVYVISGGLYGPGPHLPWGHTLLDILDSVKVALQNFPSPFIEITDKVTNYTGVKLE